MQKRLTYLVRELQPLRVGLVRLGLDTRCQLRCLELTEHEREDDGDGGGLAASAEGHGGNDVPRLREDALWRRERRRWEDRLERAEEGLCRDVSHGCEVRPTGRGVRTRARDCTRSGRFGVILVWS